MNLNSVFLYVKLLWFVYSSMTACLWLVDKKRHLQKKALGNTDQLIDPTQSIIDKIINNAFDNGNNSHNLFNIYSIKNVKKQTNSPLLFNLLSHKPQKGSCKATMFAF